MNKLEYSIAIGVLAAAAGAGLYIATTDGASVPQGKLLEWKLPLAELDKGIEFTIDKLNAGEWHTIAVVDARTVIAGTNGDQGVFRFPIEPGFYRVGSSYKDQ